jgi:hypothetical protein
MRLYEVGVSLESGISLESRAKLASGIELEEELTQWTFAERMDLARQVANALAGNQARVLCQRGFVSKFGVVELPAKPLWRAASRTRRGRPSAVLGHRSRRFPGFGFGRHVRQEAPVVRSPGSSAPDDRDSA